MTNITAIKGDITKAKVDAIVNAAGPALLGGGGVDGAIHSAAGPELLKSCRAIDDSNGIRCPSGEARITQAGELNANYVIHTVGPRYLYDKQREKLLHACYINSLELALENGCKSIAFPAISCGIYGYPVEEAANIAVKACCLKRYSNIQIYFYLYDNKTYDIWNKILH